jgi:hypothetical protein
VALYGERRYDWTKQQRLLCKNRETLAQNKEGEEKFRINGFGANSESLAVLDKREGRKRDGGALTNC